MTGQMDRIEELRVFVTVADLRGFAQAARRLGMSPAQATKLVARLEDSSLIARKLATFGAATLASPEYLKTHGTPRRPADLEQHEVIVDLNRAGPQTWNYVAGTKRVEVRVAGRLRFGNPYVCVAAAAASFGIARVPAFVAADDLRNGRLVALLKQYEPEPGGVYAVYPHAKHLPSKVRVFVDFLAGWFARAPQWREARR